MFDVKFGFVDKGGWTLWKGIGGVFVVRAVNMVSETVISEVTGFPK